MGLATRQSLKNTIPKTRDCRPLGLQLPLSDQGNGLDSSAAAQCRANQTAESNACCAATIHIEERAIVLSCNPSSAWRKTPAAVRLASSALAGFYEEEGETVLPLLLLMELPARRSRPQIGQQNLLPYL